MTPQEALEMMKTNLKLFPHAHLALNGTWATCIFALEKQIPKKYEVWNGQCCCPNCKKLFGSYDTLKTLISWEMPYCKYCGQALDWSDTE